MALMNPRLVASALYTTFATACSQHTPGHNAGAKAESVVEGDAGRLGCKHRLQYGLCMTAHIYGRGQMVIPARVRKTARIGRGDVVLVEPEGDGRILLTRLERPKPWGPSRARLVRRKGKHPVIVGGPKVTSEQIRQILNDEFINGEEKTRRMSE